MTKHKRQSTLYLLPLLKAFALSLITFSYAHPVLAQVSTEGMKPRSARTITVTGRGVETIPTTLAQVRLGVEVQGKTAAEVQQEVAQRSSELVALLKSRNVEELQTTGISLNPVYSYNNNVQRLTGYVATNTVSFQLPIDRVGMLLDQAVKAGATRIDDISFMALEPAIAAAQQQALRIAIQDAQRQANAVLNFLKLAPKEVVSIEVNNANSPQPLFRAPTALAENQVASTPVVGGEQEVEASVTLQISY